MVSKETGDRESRGPLKSSERPSEIHRVGVAETRNERESVGVGSNTNCKEKLWSLETLVLLFLCPCTLVS